ncbi:UDP-N-acetylmuramoyl-tripeptide--D-alanyl-D-alanine ligase [Salinithrix halophila]|uniref:UDP-N-acetylmuramoyl-tripeptide--D-alanyl-D-alanine ligase n=1 Tax=Salinithrix halophila TaxID=1485204 RepID=A0ABV8JDJ3_9BACL
MQKTLKAITNITNGKLIGGVSDRTLLVEGVSTDTRTLRVNQLYIPLVGERFDGHDYLVNAASQGAAAALWQEDHPLPEEPVLPLIRVKDTLVALQELAAVYRRELGVKVVAVTGSNGKTTTKELIGSVLSVKYRVHRTEGNLNNHIGLPLTLLAMPPETEVAVVEMGMNHTGEIARLSAIGAPDLAVITNVGDAHLEFLGSREAIADAKLEIREGLAENGALIVDGDEPLLRERLTEEKRQVTRIGWDAGNDDTVVDFKAEGAKGIAFTSQAVGTRFSLPIPGRYNAVNALLTVAVGRSFGLSEGEIQEGLSRVRLTGMRLEQTYAPNGMLIINDAYNASPTAMKAAIDLLVSLEGYEEKWVLLGDMLEIGPDEKKYHREVGRFAVEKGVSRIYTMGSKGAWIAEGAKEAAPEQSVVHFADAAEAASVLGADGRSGAVLLVKASRGARLEIVVEQLLKGEKKV